MDTVYVIDRNGEFEEAQQERKPLLGGGGGRQNFPQTFSFYHEYS
jgi:hypothetical protein